MSEMTCSEAFCGPRQHILLLEVHPGEVFRASGHRPILAYINNVGQKEYIATTMYANGERSAKGVLFHAYSTVTDGAATVEFTDESGVKSTTDHFWVFVLRYDMGDAELETAPGISDITGCCFWQQKSRPPGDEGQTTDHLQSLAVP